jgi:hypothetical protein
MIKTKIKVILNLIKRLLTFFIKNTIPEPRPIKYPRPTAFEIFEKEQQLACYNEFKKHFLSSVILDEINIMGHEFVILQEPSIELQVVDRTIFTSINKWMIMCSH